MAKVQGSASRPTKGNPIAKKVLRKRNVYQSEIPRYTVQEALRIPQAIADNFAKAPTKPLHLADAIDLSLNSSRFRMLVGASAAYGLTTGAWNSGAVAITLLGKRVVDARSDEEKRSALKEAFLKPGVIGAFLRKYADARLPNDNVADRVLEELGVPPDSAERARKLIFQGASELGMLREMKGSKYVDFDGLPTSSGSPTSTDEDEESVREDEQRTDSKIAEVIQIAPVKALPSTTVNNRVFITHGKNLDIVLQLKELLTFGNFAPVVAEEHETVSKPLSDKVMDDMRSCSAAIIHLGKEIKLLDREGNEHVFVNQNVLIEIGAAMALYGRKFILLVERGAKLPSNLQGLYEVRYEGDKLDYDATMKLLKAFNDFRH